MTKNEQTIESVKLAAFKTQAWLIGTIVVIVMTVAGFIGGYFVSINVITDSQSKAVSVVQDTVKTLK